MHQRNSPVRIPLQKNTPLQKPQRQLPHLPPKMRPPLQNKTRRTKQNTRTLQINKKTPTKHNGIRKRKQTRNPLKQHGKRRNQSRNNQRIPQLIKGCPSKGATANFKKNIKTPNT